MLKKTNSVVIWKGASLLDGADIVVIASGLKGSSNRKTGNMLQTYILLAGVAPTEAIKSGADSSICGSCPHRGNGDGSGRTCYVNVGQGPLSVWRAWQRGNVPTLSPKGLGEGRLVRLGTYGDPAAVPAGIWQDLLAGSIAHTGYTHQWKTHEALKGLCMASVDSEEEALVARAAGWRTFRVALPFQDPVMPNEVRCPASEEAGRKLTCEECKACGGADGRKSSIVIQAHGGFAVMANVKKRNELMGELDKRSRL